ncbi:uncharacterized protein LOC108108922 [Drosophila eugracilis]|uniref:uncharacterized protein LOC108108922 n=1 Tax=Drosophila eugracilis TaxID=29029 RepID=UPI0007E7C599|nr:uncharacterized protein LOC108108922 [Drosophila eugracilis]
MLVALIGLTLLLQVNSIAGQAFQVYSSPGVQVVYPSSSQVQVIGGRHFFRRGLLNSLRNLTITANSTNQDLQVVSSLGTGNIALSSNQVSSNAPLRNLLRTIFGRQPNVQYINLNARAFGDGSPEPQYWSNQEPRYWSNQQQAFASPVFLPRTRVKTVRQGMPRRILVRNIKSSQALMTNVETYRIPVFENEWQYDSTYA